MATPRLSIRITAFLLVATVSLGLLEAGARFLSPDSSDDFAKPAKMEIYKRIYSQEELDTNQPLQLARQGGDCIEYRMDKERIHYRSVWNPWWGYSGKRLDTDCAVKLFTSHQIKVVLLGGSAMDNAEAPNYLTRLDYFSFNDDNRIASINIAESGARLSNMVARFIHEAIDLKPDVAVFMDGFNEFNSIRYGGQPGYDYYWTVGIGRRLERPLSVLMDRLVSVSGLARILLIHTGMVHSARLRPPSPPAPDKDIEIYLRDREVARALCQHYGIECVFILQPLAFEAIPANESAARAVSLNAKYFPYDVQLYQNSYRSLRNAPCDRCVDASRLLNSVEDSYFDVVHFTKNGGAKLGSFIHQQVIEAYDRKISRDRGQ